MKILRVIEEFEGSIVEEVEIDGETYLKKWGEPGKWFVTKTKSSRVDEYMNHKISLLNLMIQDLNQEVFLLEEDVLTKIELLDIPKEYFPHPAAMHDESLRPGRL